ncbi:Endolytic murein transglycosylase [Candidatus Nitrotoga sp. BS]|uniref:endolytic transglycosylase MltG n=1 Tax=Candidatus Nitrotoga sp. BS TaxID=2890408 RepID=UPI001EF2ED73|nr:endolytic transglycosylase MltG [Candidatus Nitrotoga sp. BS]CAH1197497.1 Endolytic murein transglycosylase [Candidatus Nitrotoga sp. BS]
MRVIKRLLLIVMLMAMLLASTIGYYVIRPLTFSTLPLEFSLKQGSSLKTAALQMQQAGALPNDWMFVLLARMLGKSTQIQAGNYELETAVTMLQLLAIVTEGQTAQSKFSVIEGWTFNQFRAALNANPAIRHDSVALSESEILQRIGAMEAYAEGQFFPDTYYFVKGTGDLALLTRAYKTMQVHLQKSWQDRASDLPFKSAYEALILASIVEKETGQASDRGMVAAVFINRLRKGMLLQTDPTVIYGLGENFDGNLRKRDLLADTPYNTYTRAGMPPTPIALPGLASILATLHPASTDALYFVARGNGSSQFSNTLNEHNNAVNRYQK